VHVLPLPIVAMYDGSAAAGVALGWAEDAATRHQAPLRIVYAARSGTPPPAQILVIGAAAGYADLRATPASHAIAAGAACPVVVVHVLDRINPPIGPVLVGVDSSPEAQVAIGMAFAEAAAYGCELTAVRVWTPESPPQHGDPRIHILRTAAQGAEERDILTAALQGWREKYPDVAVLERLIAGDPGPALALLSQTARLLVTAPHRRLGTVSRHLLRHANCPIVVARATTNA
jgi:nucleotide-binding universal stress UspA family protein